MNFKEDDLLGPGADYRILCFLDGIVAAVQTVLHFEDFAKIAGTDF